jgi:hypothetical protein
MSIDFASEAAFMIRNAPGAVSVTFNGVSDMGILDRGDGFQSTDGGTMQVRTTTLRVASGIFSKFHDSARIVVDSRPYKINAFDLDADGLETVLTLVEAS